MRQDLDVYLKSEFGAVSEPDVPVDGPKNPDAPVAPSTSAAAGVKPENVTGPGAVSVKPVSTSAPLVPTSDEQHQDRNERRDRVARWAEGIEWDETQERHH